MGAGEETCVGLRRPRENRVVEQIVTHKKLGRPFLIPAEEAVRRMETSSGASAVPLAPEYAELTTPEQLQEWYQVFHAYDRDGGGDVSTTELGLMLRAVGDRVTATRLDELVAMTDLNGSGACDFEEFAGLMLRRQRETEHRAYALEGGASAAARATRVFKLLRAAIAGQDELWLWSHAPGREASRLGASAQVIAQQRWWLLGIVDHLWTSQVRILSLGLAWYTRLQARSRTVAGAHPQPALVLGLRPAVGGGDVPRARL